MVCWRWANVLSGAGLICDLVRSSSLIDHTWIVLQRGTGFHPTRPRQTAARCRKEQISDRVTAAINADGLPPWDLAGPQMCRLKFDLLRDAERIINLDSE